MVKFKDYAFKGQHILTRCWFGITQRNMVGSRSSKTFFTCCFMACFLALTYGGLFVLPIGGADMPVVISLFNSFTGVAAACGGFLYDNKLMLTGGILVGAAGTLLTILMCKAMNRSLKNVLIGSFEQHLRTPAQKRPAATKRISLAIAQWLWVMRE